ncbi:MAG: MBOAT family protein [Hyphomicrobiales bacterium]|nr:MBOAT family protein [Hyphomicrobiales bacterium]MCP5373290.1 MBOAT family protein [Hyphomicrobiales bacterium]
MLFNSHVFVLAFLPAVLVGFFIVGARGQRAAAVAWLVVASLFFYGWWDPAYLALMGASIFFNYFTGLAIARARAPGRRRALLVAGIAVNLGLLGYFKYTHFVLGQANALLGTDFHAGAIVLPLAISFFTFQQIAYLADTHGGQTLEHDFLNYCLFVTFFPQLIAGPIVHHREMLPQFARPLIYRPSYANLSIGVTIFALGLFKKVAIADSLAAYASPVFAAAEAGTSLTFVEAWCGALAYALQIYFDFSGYSDMAIGLARLFNIKLPLNFNSPYKAASIIDFWRRWHMTLSRFLRDYVYIPLGGGRRGPARRHVNILATMLLGGLWHGAGWTFVLWGGMHGVFLVVNHAWRALARRLGWAGARPHAAGRWLARLLTFTAVVLAWIPFRAQTMDGATAMWAAMAGMNGIGLDPALGDLLGPLVPALKSLGITFDGMYAHELGFKWRRAWKTIGLVLLLAHLAPNVEAVMARVRPTVDFARARLDPGPRWMAWLRWRPNFAWSLATAALAGYAVLHITRPSEFLYFQF